jgi:hypothetical protein
MSQIFDKIVGHCWEAECVSDWQSPSIGTTWRSGRVKFHPISRSVRLVMEREGTIVGYQRFKSSLRDPEIAAPTPTIS